MMAMLRAAGLDLLSDEARPADESNPRGYFELEAVRRTRSDTSWLTHAPGRAVKVIHRLLRDLPHDRSYRVILMERKPSEVVASQNRMLERLGQPRSDLPAERLARIFAAQNDETKELLEHEACFQWLSVSYEELILRPLALAERVATYLGLDSQAADAMARVVDPALHRTRH